MPMEFDRLVAYFDADVSPLEKKGKRAHKIVDDLEARIKKMKWDFAGGKDTAAESKKQADAHVRAWQDAQRRANREAASDLRRFQAERARIERENTRAVERESRTQARTREREFKRSMNQMIADSKRRQAVERRSMFSGFGARNAVLGGISAAGAYSAITAVTGSLTSIAREGRAAYGELDQLVRFVATLDQRFQSPAALAKLKKDIEDLSLVVPQSADAIARAAFTIKSSYPDLQETQLIEYLRKLSIHATASNTTVDVHAQRVAALAKMYNITAGELDKFGAILSTSFGMALSEDAQVAEGFNQILVSARIMKQPLEEVAAAMGAIQSATGKAEENTTNLQNLYAKLGDGKYIKGLKETFNVDVFDAKGNWKTLNQIINEIDKSLQGLSDKEKTAKMFEVFKDLQARKGVLSLLEVIEQYNRAVREGADTQGFAQKTDVMLSSAEARWQLFVNRLDDRKREIGERVSDMLAAPAEPETGAGSLSIGFSEFVKTVDQAAIAGLEGFTLAAQNTVGSGLEKMSIISPAQLEQAKMNAKTSFAELQKEIVEGAESHRVQVLAGELIKFESIAKDPKAGAELRQSAEESAARLREGLTRAFTDMEPVQIERLKVFYGPEVWAQITKDIKDPLVEAYKRAFVEAGGALQSGDPALAKTGARQMEQLKLDLIAQINRGDLSAEVRTALIAQLRQIPDIAPGVKETGKPLGESLGQGIAQGTSEQKDVVTNAANEAMTGDTTAAHNKGAPLGLSFVQGVAMGISNNIPLVGPAIAALMNYMSSSGQKEQESHSPSARAARELGVPFVQGIEMGILQRQAALANTVARVLGRAMFDGKKKKKGKSKKQSDEAVRELLTDLGIDSSRIDAEAARTNAAIDRFYDALLADQTSEFDTQAARVDEFYQKIYDNEEAAYQRRLANIQQRENAISKLKKIKDVERTRELKKLADERADVEADQEQRRFENMRDRAAAIAAAGQREIERQQRSLARELRLGDINRVGGPGSAEDVATRESQNRLRLIDEEIVRQRELRDSLLFGSKARIEVENKIKDLFEERKDAEVEGMEEIKQAREEDRQSLEDYYRAVADFAGQTRDAEFEAAEARLELMRESGAKEKDIFLAEIDLERERENFRHEQRQFEITALAQDLINRAQTREEILEIERNFNAQMEQETQRHNAVMGQLTARQGQTSILGQWKQIADRLPTWQQQLKDFAVGLPGIIGDSFGQALTQFDGTWNGFLDNLKTAFFRTLQEMLAELFRTQLIKLLIQLGSSIVGAFGGAGASARGAAGGFAGGAVGGVGGFAEGGVPPIGRPSVVGENGPEIFVPKVAGRILSNEDSKQALAGRGGTTINAVINHNYRERRMLTAPKSVRQNTESSLAALASNSGR